MRKQDDLRRDFPPFLYSQPASHLSGTLGRKQVTMIQIALGFPRDFFKDWGEGEEKLCKKYEGNRGIPLYFERCGYLKKSLQSSFLRFCYLMIGIRKIFLNKKN